MSKQEHFSARELNTFVYCPMQWYLTRVYKAANLRELYRAKHSPDSAQESNFARGQRFHKEFRAKQNAKLVGAVVAFIVVLGLVLFLTFWLGGA